MTTRQQDSDGRDDGRVPLECPVGIRYRLFQEFIQEVSANISVGGMFIATSRPHEPGSQFEFELSLEDGFTLVKGRGEVVWTRDDSPGLNLPGGMGVRFLKLEGASQTLVTKIVENHRKKGRTPFDVEKEGARQAAREQPKTPVKIDEEVLRELLNGPPGPAQQQAVDVASQPAAENPDYDGRPRAPRFVLLSLIAIFAGLLFVLLFNYLYVRPRIDDLERRIENLSEPVGSVGKPSPAEESSEPGDEQAEIIEEPALDPTDPIGAVREWARAWSEQRTEDYLAAYSVQFEPAGELTREQWESLRRTRIGNGSEIHVQVLLAEETELGPDERIVSFVQAYRSETYHDRVRKVVRMIWEDEAWKIVEERVIRSLPD